MKQSSSAHIRYNNAVHRYVAMESTFPTHRWLWFSLLRICQAVQGVKNKQKHPLFPQTPPWSLLDKPNVRSLNYPFPSYLTSICNLTKVLSTRPVDGHGHGGYGSVVFCLFELFEGIYAAFTQQSIIFVTNLQTLSASKKELVTPVREALVSVSKQNAYC